MTPTIHRPIRSVALWLAALALLLTPISAPNVFAQDAPLTGTISGKVLVKSVRRPVSYVQVSLDDTDLSATTDDDGVFTIEAAPAGDHTIRVVGEGIEETTKSVTVAAGETTKVNLYVIEIGYALDEVVVTAEKEPEVMARQELSREEISSVPGANNDVIRVVETLPGVAYTSVAGFGTSGLVIRGTSGEDSQYFLNGFEIPQLFHFGGFVSIINSELVEDIAYYPGAYNVSYGNALGGVIQVTTRPPRKDRFGGVVDLSSYSTFALLEGPAGEKAAWSATVRRSLIDFVLPAVVPDDQASFTLAPRFYDYTAMFNYQPNLNNII